MNANSIAMRQAEPDTAPQSQLRIALFSGNYNIVRDGANKALNRLVDFLLERGAAVRIYSPTTDRPAFAPSGDLVSVPSLPIPRRSDYRLALGLTAAIRADIRRFRPTHFHLSCPDLLGTQAQMFARELGVPVVASMHTRFETYFRYYGLGFLAPLVERRLRKFYARSDLVLAPNAPIAAELRAGGFARQIRIWGRGVDRELFNPSRRSRQWRRARGFAEDEIVILFFGRLVREKGLGQFEAAIAELRRRGHRIRPLVVGDGPERAGLEARLGDAVFTGHLEGPALAEAVASADILVNPSLTEAFGNVILEAMASGLAVVSADASSARALIGDHAAGMLVARDDAGAYADAVEQLIRSPSRRRLLAAAAVLASAAFTWSDVLGSVLDCYVAMG
ncbi:MAG TPA: glycosyltransferase family 1 protein [Allosphingosinicella sp.]|nr:glycosyltransferase family 1 protein [Allosphingosinicella sp.]